MSEADSRAMSSEILDRVRQDEDQVIIEKETERELDQALVVVSQEQLTAGCIVSALVQTDPNIFAST